MSLESLFGAFAEESISGIKKEIDEKEEAMRKIFFSNEEEGSVQFEEKINALKITTFQKLSELEKKFSQSPTLRESSLNLVDIEQTINDVKRRALEKNESRKHELQEKYTTLTNQVSDFTRQIHKSYSEVKEILEVFSDREKFIDGILAQIDMEFHENIEKSPLFSES